MVPVKPFDSPSPTHPTRSANFYENGPLAREGDKRSDLQAILKNVHQQKIYYIPIWRNLNLVYLSSKEESHIMKKPLWLSEEDLILSDINPQFTTFLGIWDDCAYFAVDFSYMDTPPFTEKGEFVDLRTFSAFLDHNSGAVLAYARGLMHWHNRHIFCGICGTLTESLEAGHVRKCSKETCQTSHFPRLDPAVIMAIHNGGDKLLLARQAVWPAGMHSVLAGFVEPGESLEDAVIREVYEEVGINITDIHYHSSQPWPFPSSLMIGFFARALDETIYTNTQEIETAHWYHRSELLTSPENTDFCLPRRDSIAWRLIVDWLNADKNS